MLTSKVIGELSKQLTPFSDEQEANAAVALILKPAKDDSEILLVKRAQNPNDTWSGHMALPGGKRDAKDADLQETVLRETFEETSINLQGSPVLGVFSVVCSQRRPDMRVLPFVFGVASEPRVTLSRSELETFVWVPYKQLLGSRGTAQIGSRMVPAFILGKNVVWGLTYKILDEFIQTTQPLLNQQQ